MVHADGKNPQWDEVFRFPIDDRDHTVKITVCDESYGDEDPIGK